ncbi:MAG TPA: hypothetical protein DD417_06115 [Elusimicrobia bacterium]|nr:hypothetical protein [Elusimicrobiota bacterium]
MNDTVPPPPAPQETWSPAGFWIRLLADIIDSLIVYTPVAVVLGAAAAAVGTFHSADVLLAKMLASLAAGGVYYTFLTGRSGQTWGKKVCDIKVVQEDGAPLSYGRAFWRWCAYLPSYLSLGIGFMMAGWNTDKKALHDFLAGTRVLRRVPPGGARFGSPWKIIGLLIAVGVLAATLAAAALYAWLRRNSGTLLEQGRTVTAEGAAFGRDTDQPGCVKEALGRLAQAGLIDQALARIFLQKCLGAARPVGGFCSGVPPESSILATVDWRLQTCASLGYVSDQSCARLLSGVQRHCAAPPQSSARR